VTRVLVLLLLTLAAPARAQQPSVTATSAAARALVLRGLDGVSRPLSAADVGRLARHDTTVAAHHVSGRFGGALLSDVLALVHAPAGDSLRGAALRGYVRVEGADGYTVILTLAELDAGVAGHVAILADRRDGAPLASKDGPYQLIVPGDRRPARWVRQVARITLARAP
jgi:hypothetical protein